MTVINAQRLIPRTTRISARRIAVPQRDLIIIRNRVVKIRDILRSYNTLRARDFARQRISRENISDRRIRGRRTYYRGRRESEKPGLGFLSSIRAFLDRLVFAIIGMKMLPMIKYLPAIVKGVGTAVDFASDLFIRMFDGLAGFVEKGYEAYDFTRKQLKSFGGDNIVKIFDGFNNALENVFTGAIIAGFALSDLGKKGGGSGGGGMGYGPRRGYDVGGRRVGIRAQERYLQRYGERQFAERFGERALRRAVSRGAAQTVEKGVLRTLVKRIPVVGALIDFALNYFVFKEPLGESAFRAVGSALVGAFGGLLGAFPPLVPFGGPLIGYALGGWAGDALASMLFDSIFRGKQPPKSQAAKQAGGGPVPTTRGGRLVASRPTRRKPTQKYKRELQARVSPLKPGSSVGGMEKIKKMYPEPENKEKNNTINPLKYQQKSYKNLTRASGFGGIFALALKAQLGEKPTDLDYRNAASGILSWMQITFSDQVLRTGGAFAGGGEVNSSMFMTNNTTDMKSVIAKSIQNSVTPKINESIGDLMKQLGLKEIQGKVKETPSSSTQSSRAGDYSPEGLQGDIYKYLLSKGLDDNQALGVMANISRESGFRPGISESGGPGIGLFQYSSEPRKTNFLRAVPDYATNWKGQIDFALTDDVAPQYIKTKFSSAQEAADWWMKNWERPAEDIQNISGPKIHKEYLASLQKYRTGKGYIIPTSGDILGNVQGNLSDAKNLAESMGLQLSSYKRDPRYPGDASLHIQGRAMDFSNGIDTLEQKKFALSMISKYGSNLAELIYTPLGYGIKNGQKVPLSFWSEETNAGHYNHVHVAFAKGGRVRKPTTALIGERGPEFIFDADTTRGLDSLAPGLLEKLNIARTKPQIASILRSYADYEEYAEKTVYVVRQPAQMIPVPYAVPSQFSSGITGGTNGISNRDVLFSGT